MLDKAAPRASIATTTASRRFGTAVALLAVVGFVLRLAAARGDLWLDEIWSFVIVGKAASLADVVLALPYDNNHVLNSVWLKLVGDQAPAIIVRLPAVVFGTLCIPVAARLGARVSPVAGIAMAAVVAIDDVFVHFGSEARGYSGLILGFLLALDALEARLAGDARRTTIIVFALAICFGTFSHLTMLEASCLLCATAALRLILSQRLRGAWPRRLAPILVAAWLGSLPPLACVVVSLFSGPLHVGLATAFAFAPFAEGLGGMVRATLGLWPMPLPRATSEFLLPLAGLGVIAALPLLPPQRRVLPALGLLALPLAHAALHLPNQLYARFHLVIGVCLALFVAELWARAWIRGPAARALALVAGVGFLAGQAAQLVPFLVDGRGHFAAATAAMTAQGPTRVAALPAVAAPETAAVMRWYAERAGRAAGVTLVPDAALCATPPDWLVIIHRPDDAQDQSDAQRLAVTGCAGQFAPVRTYRGYGLSGFAWTVLRRRPTS